MRFALLMVFLGLASLTPANSATIADQAYRLDDLNRLSTDVIINGSGPYSFLLDTASSMSFLFEPARLRLGLLPEAASESFTTYGFHEGVRTQSVQLNELKLSDLIYHDMPVGIVAGQSGVADGILGIDALDRFVLVLDREQMRLRLLSAEDNGAQAWRDWGAAELQPRILHEVNSRFWSTHAEFSGHRFAALLDLGAGITIINWKAAELLGIRQSAFNALGPPDKRLRDMLGATAPAVNTFADIQMGGQRFAHQRVLIANAPVFEFSGLSDGPAALIGTGLLGSHSLAVDFPNHRMYIGPEASSFKAAVN